MKAMEAHLTLVNFTVLNKFRLGTTSGKVKHDVDMEFEDWRLSDDCDFT